MHVGSEEDIAACDTIDDIESVKATLATVGVGGGLVSGMSSVDLVTRGLHPIDAHEAPRAVEVVANMTNLALLGLEVGVAVGGLWLALEVRARYRHTNERLVELQSETE